MIAELEQFASCAAVKALVENLAVIGSHQSRMMLAADTGQLKQFLTQCDHIVCQTRSFVGWIEASHQPAILRGNPGWAVTCMAALCLNTAD